MVSGLLEESKGGSGEERGEASGGGAEGGAGWRAGRQLHAICLLCSLGRALFIYAARIFIPTPFSLLLQETARIVTYLAA